MFVNPNHKLAIFFLLLLSTTSNASESPQAHEFVLKNGLKLIVKEDHRAPVVVSQIWYKVGSSYEHNGITGVSHVLEHMMFKGTKKYPPGEFSRIISKNGGRENAFTGQDYTAYFQQLEKSRLNISFELEADRMRNLTLPEKEFDKEINVVMEERRLRTEDNPQSLTHEQFAATAFINNPYQNPVIGWMSDLKNMKVADLRDWYQKWYAPNNAVLVVVGDVEPGEVYRLAKKYFAKLKPGDLPEQKPRRESPQQGTKTLTVNAPAELPYLLMGYKVPVLNTAENAWEPYALEVLAGILDGGNSARLASRLVRGSQVAANAGAGYNMITKHDELFMLDGTPSEGHTIQELEEALIEQINNIKTQQVTKAELELIKAQVIAGKVYERDSIFYQAMQIGMLETVGLDWQLMDQYIDRIKSVSAEQVQKVANKYLVNDHLTVAVLNPLPLEQNNNSHSTMGTGHHDH